MSNKLPCEVCKTEMDVVPPPFPPQIQNGTMMSTMAMMNGHAQCPQCGAKYVTHIAGVNVQLGFTQVKEQPRIVVPNMVAPRILN